MTQSRVGHSCLSAGVILPGVNSIAPFRNACSLTVIVSPRHFTRNIWILCTSQRRTPGCWAAPAVRSRRPASCVRISCNRLGFCVSTVSKSTESCTKPKSSRGAQLLRTSRSWSSAGKPRKHGTFFTNLKVLRSTSQAALITDCGARMATSFLMDAQEQHRCAAVVSSRACGHRASLLRML